MKPGMTRPMPFSIQMPTMLSTQAMLRYFNPRLSGSTSRTIAMRLKPTAVQIHGTSAWCPCRPTKRYFAEAPWAVPE